MIAYLGNEEVVFVQVPRGTHNQATRLGLDLQALALDAVISRVRAASLASQMMDRTQTRFGQSRLNAE